MTKGDAVSDLTTTDEWGARLRQAMSGARVTPSELARLLAVHPTTVSRWRRGERTEERTIRLLGIALQVSPRWLARGEGEMVAPPSAVYRRLDLPSREKLIRERLNASMPVEALVTSIERTQEEVWEDAARVHGADSDAGPEEEQVRAAVRDVERTIRAHIPDPKMVPIDWIRDLRMTMVEMFILQAREAGRAVPPFLHQLYYELDKGQFS